MKGEGREKEEEAAKSVMALVVQVLRGERAVEGGEDGSMCLI